MGTPFQSSNSNVGKQDKMVSVSDGLMSDDNGQNSASGDISGAKSVSEGAVEGSGRPAGKVNAGSGRICDGPQDQMSESGSDDKGRPTGF